jgi:hypothetical protein
MVFQIFDVTAYGGLRQVHSLPGPGKALMLDDFAKYIKLPEIHPVVRLSAKRSIQVIRYLLLVICLRGLNSVLIYHQLSDSINE